MTFDGQLLTIADFEHYARQAVSPAMFEFFYGTLGDPEWSTYTANRKGFDELQLLARVLTGAGERDLGTSVLGHELSLPVMIGPTGLLGELDPAGEVSAARAAGAAGTAYALAAFSSVPAADVAAAAAGPWFQQVFMQKNRAVTEWQVRNAADLGAAAIILTVSNAGDTWHHQVFRYPSAQSFFASAPAPNLAGYPGAETPSHDQMAADIDQSVSWVDVDWLRSLVEIPVIVKGIQTAEDAELAVEHGVDAIVVSNHGGRYLQGSRGTIQALPDVVGAASGRLEVYLDGGVTHGEDVLKALALGARAVLIGRAARWGQTVAGRKGLEEVLAIYRKELDGAMGLAGIGDVASAAPQALASR